MTSPGDTEAMLQSPLQNTASRCTKVLRRHFHVRCDPPDLCTAVQFLEPRMPVNARVGMDMDEILFDHY